MTRAQAWLGLSLIVVLGCWTGPLPAQDPPAPAAPSCPCANAPPPGAPSQQKPGLRQRLNRCGLGCQADPDAACDSLHSTTRFVFGSCRTFFGEPCVPNPPHGLRQAP